MPIPTLTLEMLDEYGAWAEGMEAFEQNFPEGLPVSAAGVREACDKLNAEFVAWGVGGDALWNITRTLDDQTAEGITAWGREEAALVARVVRKAIREGREL